MQPVRSPFAPTLCSGRIQIVCVRAFVYVELISFCSSSVRVGSMRCSHVGNAATFAGNPATFVLRRATLHLRRRDSGDSSEVTIGEGDRR